MSTEETTASTEKKPVIKKAKVINLRLYPPQKQNQYGEIQGHACTNSDKCDRYILYGECVSSGANNRYSLKSPWCPYAHKIAETSPTTARAKAYDTWLENALIKYGIPHKTNSIETGTAAPEKILKIGDYMCVPYENYGEDAYLQGLISITNNKFISKELWTPENIKLLYCRTSIMNKHLFLRHLTEDYPEMARGVFTTEEIDKVLSQMSNVGRIAYVTTLKPGAKIPRRYLYGTVAEESKYWTWDGRELVMVNTADHQCKILENKDDVSYAEIVVVPSDDAKVEVKSEDWIEPGVTEFWN